MNESMIGWCWIRWSDCQTKDNGQLRNHEVTKGSSRDASCLQPGFLFHMMTLLKEILTLWFPFGCLILPTLIASTARYISLWSGKQVHGVFFLSSHCIDCYKLAKLLRDYSIWQSNPKMQIWPPRKNCTADDNGSMRWSVGL